MSSRFTGAVLAVVALVALDAPQTGFPASAGSAGAQSYVYNAKGRLLGHIERTAPGNWWVSDSFNSSVELVAANRMRITEGFHYYGFAKRRSPRRWDVYRDAYGGPVYEGSIRRFSSMRWNAFRKGRRIGHARGRGLDAVAAAFAYVFWGADCFATI